MKNLADFKKKLRVGINLHCTFHQDCTGRDENGNLLYKDKDKGVREVSIVQSRRKLCRVRNCVGEPLGNNDCEPVIIHE